MAEKKTRFTVQYKGTGTNWPQETQKIKAGRFGDFEFLCKSDEEGNVDGENEDRKVPVILNAEDGVASCKRWFNERLVDPEKRTPDGALVSAAKMIYGNHVFVWIEEWEDGVMIGSGEAEACAESNEQDENSSTESGNTESNTKSTERSSRKRPGMKPSRISQSETAAV